MHLSFRQIILNYLYFFCEITGFFQCTRMVKFQQILNFSWVMEMVGIPDWKSRGVLSFSPLLYWYFAMQNHL